MNKGQRNARLVLAYMAFAVIVVIAGSVWIARTDNERPSAAEPEGISMLRQAAELAPGETFARRIVGRWTTRTGEGCRDGAEITLEGGRLIITQSQRRTEHLLFYDTRFETRTQTEDASATEDYIFAPEFVATSGERNFNLVITNTSRNRTVTWSPCELA